MADRVGGEQGDGWGALAAGEWESARSSFEAALRDDATPSGLDGLGRARWWLDDTRGAIEAWDRAYAAYRRAGDGPSAARMALLLCKEYAEVVGNGAAAGGWLARAERLVQEGPPSPAEGWLVLTKAERAIDPTEAASLAGKALAAGQRFGDPDLELSALGQVALAEIRIGDVESGMRHFDEAMASATGSEPRDLRTLGDLYCSLTVASEVTLDVARFGQWTEAVMGFLSRHRHPALFTFCGTCCAEVVGAMGDWAEGERWLVDTMRSLESTGQRPRCVHPATRLASLRVQQGRLEEAEHLLEGYEDLPEAVQPMVSLHLARGQAALAAARLHRRLNQIGRDSLLAAPLLVQLADAQVARGDVAGALQTADTLAAIGERSGLERIRAEANLAAGSAMTEVNDPAAATKLGEALDSFTRLALPHASARTRIVLARCLAPTDPDVAVEEARQALASFERLGATREADSAALFLRSLGVRGRTGSRGHTDVLTKREVEVLRLLGDGFTNAEIAARLYISTKTAATHVGNVLSKLGLRNRAEAAVFAERHLPPESATV